jgi:hypothetical protein
MRMAISLVMRWCLVALLVVPGGAVSALPIVDSSLTISSLTIAPITGSASVEAPLFTSATTHAFDSLGEEVAGPPERGSADAVQAAQKALNS